MWECLKGNWQIENSALLAVYRKGTVADQNLYWPSIQICLGPDDTHVWQLKARAKIDRPLRVPADLHSTRSFNHTPEVKFGKLFIIICKRENSQ